tara:strand:- start:184 stop:639 length:456 start_codon:yes stop_codon:yes gene_type:complete
MFRLSVFLQLWVAMLTLSALSVSARADISIHDLEFRAGIDGRPGIIFARLTNNGALADNLVGVDSPHARIELHAHEMRDNIMRMRRVDAFSLAPDTDLVLKSGGRHLMVFDLAHEEHKSPLRLTFRFEHSPAVRAEVSHGDSHEAGRHKHY